MPRRPAKSKSVGASSPLFSAAVATGYPLAIICPRHPARAWAAISAALLAHRDRHIAQIDIAGRHLVPVDAAIAQRRDNGLGGCAGGADHFNLAALGRRHIGRDADRFDTRMLIGSVIEYH